MRKNQLGMVFFERVATFPLRKKKNTSHKNTNGPYINQQQKTNSWHTCSCCSHLCYIICVDHPYCLCFLWKSFSNHSTIPSRRWNSRELWALRAFKLQLFTCFAKPWVEASMKRSGKTKWLGDDRKKFIGSNLWRGLKVVGRGGLGWFLLPIFEVIEPFHNMLESI